MPQCVRSRLVVFIILTAASVVLLDASRAIAQPVTLQWDANSDPQVAGYRIYYGKTSGNYTQQIDAGKTTSYVVTGIDATKNHYFAVRAYAFDGTLSGPSNEVSLFGPGITGGSPLGGALSRVDMQSPLMFSANVRETDVAHDPVNGVYFVVGAHGPVWGAFTDASGKLLSTVHINNTTPGLARHPRVAYSPHIANGTGGLGGFLVTWHEGTTAGHVVRARGVAYPNHLVTATTTVHANARTQPGHGAPVAYSPTSKAFLVALEDASGGVHAVRLNVSGQPIGAAIPLSTAASAPGVAWNSHLNEFGVVFTGREPANGTTTFVRVSSAGTVLRNNTFNYVGPTIGSDVAFNSATGRYVAVWSQHGTMGAEIDGSGDVIASGLISSLHGPNDKLAIAYNKASGTFLLVGQGTGPEVWGTELSARGVSMAGDVSVTAVGLASFPRVGAHSSLPLWNVSFTQNFGALGNQVVHTSSSAGGLAGDLQTGLCLTPDPFTAMGGGTCKNGGWIPASAGGYSAGGSTGGCPGSAPFPGAVCVNGGWIPGSTTGGSVPAASSAAPAPSSPAPGACPGTAPFPGAVCVNGGWVPGSTTGGSAPAASSGAPAPSSSATGACPGTAPFPGAVCANGGWVPGSTTGGSAPAASTAVPTPAPPAASGCLGASPFPGAVCVNGGWIPGSTTGGSAPAASSAVPAPVPTATGGCLGAAPFPGAVCANGGWIPGSTTGGSAPAPSSAAPAPAPPATSGCLGTAPFPGAVCANGGWIPGSTSGPAGPPPAPVPSGTCATPDPFTAMGGGICVDGGWRPRPQ